MQSPSGKVLITGASGFVGKYLINELLQHGYEIYAAVYGKGNELMGVLPSDHIIAGDMTDSHFTDHLIQVSQPDTVYHLAALAVVQDSDVKAAQVLSSNIVLQYNILESVRRLSPASRVIAVCSAHEYGLVDPKDIPIDEETPLKPLNPYAVSKVAQDMLSYQYFLTYGLDVVRVRPFNHTGPGQTTDFVIPSLARQCAQIAAGHKEPVIDIGNTDSIRDFTDVRDMVRAYRLAAAKCESGQVYNIGYGKGIKIAEIITLFEEIAGITVRVVTHPELTRRSDVPVLVSDSLRFRTQTGWAPEIALKDTLREVYNYYRDNTNKEI